jgi:hypothetical protein
VRVFVLLAIASVTAGCNASAFACADDGDCQLGGEPGVCVVGNCAYPDPACPSGYRYPAGLGNGLAGECVSPDDVGGSDTEMDGSTSAATGTTAPASSSDATAVDASSSSTGEEVVDTTSVVESTGFMGSSSSSTGDKGDSTTGSETTASVSITDPGMECTDLGCADCMRCVDGPGEACSDPAQACFSLVGCAEAAACMESCVAFMDCAADCCAGFDVMTATAALQLNDCRVDACNVVCEAVEVGCG